MKKIIKPLTAFFLAFSLVVAIAVLVLYIATPLLGKKKLEIEHFATEIIHQPVKIESSEGIWFDTNPGFLLKNITIFDPKGIQPPLKIAEIQVGLKILNSLWQKQPVLGHLSIKGAHLALHQDANNNITVDGLSNISQQTTFDLMPWIASMNKISMDNISIDWQKPDGHWVKIPYVKVAIKNSWYEQQGTLKLNQTEVGDLLTGFSLKAWQIPRGKINSLNLHWIIRYQTLNYLKGSINAEHISIIPPALGLPAKQETQQSPALTQVNKEDKRLVQQHQKLTSEGHPPTQVTWSIQSLSSHFLWRGKINDQWSLKLQRLRFNLDGKEWAEKILQVGVLPIKQGGWVYSLRASNVQLSKLWPLLNKLQLLSPDHSALIAHLNPKGDLKNIYFEYPQTTAPLENKTVLPWKFSAEIHDLSTTSWDKIPGIDKLTGYLQTSNNIGQLRLDSEKLKLIWPNLFRTPLFFEHAQTNIDWRILPTGYKINASGIDVDNSDIKFKGDMSLWLPTNVSNPFIHLFGEFKINPHAKIAAYLPISIMKTNLIKWFDQAFVSIGGGNGTLVLRGPLNQFPFAHQEGTFAAHAQFNDVNFSYLADWPIMTHLVGKLNFDGPKMSIAIDSGKIFDMQIKSAYAEIPALLKNVEANLHSKINLAGDLRDASHFIQQSPLNKKLGGGFGKIKLNGDSEINLKLDIPLENDKAPTQVKGSIDMAEAKAVLPFKQLTFENITGILHFTQDNIRADNIQAEFLHAPVSLTIENDKNTTLLKLKGKARVKDVQKTLGLPASPSITGNFSYHAKLALTQSSSQNPNQLSVTSDLQGVRVDLPAPFNTPVNKTSDSQIPSQINLSFAENSPLNIQFNYGDRLKGLLDFNAENFTFKSGNIVVSTIKLLEQNYNNILLNLSRTTDHWLVGIECANAVGKINIPDNRKEVWKARFQKLYLPKSANNKKSNIKPSDIPRLDFFAQDFRYGGKIFGQTRLILEPANYGLRIQQMSTESPAFSFSTQGRWQASSHHDYTNLTGQLHIHNIGETLLRFGMPASVVGKDGKVSFNLEWPGVPYDPLFTQLSGRIDIALNDGLIINLGEETSRKIGMGALLNFFGLQNLPKRLALDFSDVTKQGFPFNTMRGSFILKQGNAYTKDTYLEGSVAHISMKGHISLANENYDVYLHVTPYITSSLPLVATIAGGPVIGLTAWVADKLLSKQVAKIMTYSYHMHGPWSNPNVATVAVQPSGKSPVTASEVSKPVVMPAE